MNWKGCARQKFCPNLRFYPSIFLVQNNENPQSVWVCQPRLNQTPNRYMSEALTFEQVFLVSWYKFELSVTCSCVLVSVMCFQYCTFIFSYSKLLSLRIYDLMYLKNKEECMTVLKSNLPNCNIEILDRVPAVMWAVRTTEVLVHCYVCGYIGITLK